LKRLMVGFSVGCGLLWILALLSLVSNSDAEDADYQKRLSNLKESQAQTQVMLNQLGGFSSTRSPAISSNEEEDERKRPIFKVHSELRTNRIRTGSVFRGANLNRLIVGGEPAPGIIQLDDNQGNMSGLKLLASVRPSGTDGRIHLEINRLLLRSGRVITVNAVGLDSAGSQGLQAHVFSGKALAVLGSIASSFVAGVAAAQQAQTTNAFGFTQNQTTGRNAILGGVAQTAADQSKRLIDESTSEKPVLVLDENTPIAIFFNEEVKF
jgi:hypothetical protein